MRHAEGIHEFQRTRVARLPKMLFLSLPKIVPLPMSVDSFGVRALPIQSCSVRKQWLRLKAQIVAVVGGMILTSLTSALAQGPAQQGRYFPLDQHVPPGMVAEWAARLGKSTPGVLQPVRIALPSTGQVTFYQFAAQMQATDVKSPAVAGCAVGHTYRLKISHMPEFPGIDLYPTIEIVDRLHPPEGQSDRFPIPIEFTTDELELALDGHMVTRVVYLEQPELAGLKLRQNGSRIPTLAGKSNLLAEADRLGRPMLIIRLGGRLPSALGNEPGFYGIPAPLTVMQAK